MTSNALLKEITLVVIEKNNAKTGLKRKNRKYCRSY